MNFLAVLFVMSYFGPAHASGVDSSGGAEGMASAQIVFEELRTAGFSPFKIGNNVSFGARELFCTKPESEPAFTSCSAIDYLSGNVIHFKNPHPISVHVEEALMEELPQENINGEVTLKVSLVICSELIDTSFICISRKGK